MLQSTTRKRLSTVPFQTSGGSLGGWKETRGARTLLHLALTFDEMPVLYSGRHGGTYEITASGSKSWQLISGTPPRFFSSDSRFDVNLPT